jgi:hypothetical protein
VLRALGREPSEATRTVERTVGVAAPFVGRVAQLGELNQALVDSRRAGVTVFVHGASGMGKSVLVNRFLDGLTDRALVLAGRCYEREAVPYKTLDTLIDALTGALLRLPPTQLGALLPDDITALARLFPVLRRVPQIAEPIHRRFQPTDPQELRRRGWNALRVLLTRLATQRPLVIVVDDLQWGDDDSVGFLVELIARADRPPLLLVLLHRTEDRDGAILSAIHKRITGGSIVPDVRTLEVLPLALDEATDLVATLSGLPGGSSEWAESLVRDAGGNTLFLSELARSAVSANGAATLDELLRASGSPGCPTTPARCYARSRWPAAPWRRPWPRPAAGVDDAGGALATLRAERLVRGPGPIAIRSSRTTIASARRSSTSWPPASCRPRTASWPTPTSTRCRAIASRWSITCSAPASRRPRPSTRSRPRPPPPRRWRSAAPPTCTRSRCEFGSFDDARRALRAA